ncbi:hypothetical protein MNV49_002350 [Pseudohyphozyma bogoriensis]|nr:hypothetical protein MNV49_002350 [Pseudohyphozyma bogoriensis]
MSLFLRRTPAALRRESPLVPLVCPRSVANLPEPRPRPPASSHLPTASSSLVPISQFSTTAPTSESKKRRKSRLTLKNHLLKKSSALQAFVAATPDPVLGYGKGKEELWEKSLLKSVLLRREDVWGETVERVEEADELSVSAANKLRKKRAAEGLDEPEHYNFGLTEEEVKLLTKDLPEVNATRIFSEGPADSVYTSLAEEKYESAIEQEQAKMERLRRIVDLKNADSKGIEAENRRRIFKAFGRKEGDTGSPEVQAALMTAQIRSLHSHLLSQPRDIQNQRPLRVLAHKRATVLKYLRGLDVQRYEVCLANIGVEARAVEGEVNVTKAGMRGLIRPE